MGAEVKPLAVDLFCGLGGFTEGLIAENFECVGFDIERHDYGQGGYPAQLVLQDVLTLHGRQFKDAALIVASPPCTEFSYMAMPWRRAKQIERALLGEDEFPRGYKGSRTKAELTALFDACFRIQREASEAAGHHIPMVVENVRGAQKWVGRSRWNYGSYHLWGDVPALMPIVQRGALKAGVSHRSDGSTNFHGTKVPGLNWSKHAEPDYRTSGAGGCFRDSAFKGMPHRLGGHWTNPAEHRGDGIKQGGEWWHDTNSMTRMYSSKSPKRKAASALIARIPLELARHIAAVYKP